MSMKKRQATTDLNHDNWDDEDPKDDEDPMGKFKTAPQEELQKRVIRTAKRRTLNATRMDPTASSSPFGALSGFKRAPPSSFDFLSKLTSGPTCGGSTGDTSSSPFGKRSRTTFNANQEENTMQANPISSPFGNNSKTTFNPNQEDNTMQANPNFVSPFGKLPKSTFSPSQEENTMQATPKSSPFGNLSKTTFNANQEENTMQANPNFASPFGKLSKSTFSPSQGENTMQATPKTSPFGNLAKKTFSPNHEVNTMQANTNLFGSPSSTAMFTPNKSDVKSTFASTGFTFKSNKDADTSSPLAPKVSDPKSGSLFQNTSPATSNNTVFGSNTSGSVFSGSIATTNSVFGAPKPPAPLFSSNTTTSASTGSKSLFGPQTTNSSLFSTLTSPPKTSNTFGSETQSTLFTPSQLVTGSKESPFKISGTATLSNSNADFQYKTSTVGSMPSQVSASIFGSNNKISVETTSNNKVAVATKSNTINSEQGQYKVSTNFKITTKNVASDQELREATANASLKNLNEAFVAFIKHCVDSSPYCVLYPCFQSYDEHMQEIRLKYKNGFNYATDPTGTNSSTDTSKTETNNNVTDAPSVSPFKIPAIPAVRPESPSTYATSQSFVAKQSSNIPSTATTSNTTPHNTFSFGIISSPSTTGNTTPRNTFSFGIKSSPSTTSNTTPSIGSAFGTKTINTLPNTIMTSSAGFSFGTTSNPSAISAPTNPNFTFGINPSTGNTTSSPGFSSGFKPAPEETTTPFVANNFSFGSKPPENAVQNKPFSFDVGKPFSFNSNIIQKPAEKTEEQKDEEDEPPKVEYTPVVEENSVYEKKCKVFVKKDGNFVDKGVGTLYVKKVDSSGKHQILVRANNNLGTVLLNFILSSGIPTQRMGKNNVMLVCIPTPESKPPPTPTLIRVKTSEEADELLAELNKLKS